MARKLDWFPVYVHRAKASGSWAFPDYLFGQFWRLIFELVDSDCPGYLQYDLRLLWRIARVSVGYEQWARGSWPTLARYFRVTDATAEQEARGLRGKVISSERLLEVLEEQGAKQRRRVVNALSFSISPVMQGLTEQIYNAYPRKEGRKAALESIARAITRHAKRQGFAEVEAAEFIHNVTLSFADSPVGKWLLERDPPLPTTFYNQDRFLDDPDNWHKGKRKAEAGNGNGVRSKREEILARVFDGDDDAAD